MFSCKIKKYISVKLAETFDVELDEGTELGLRADLALVQSGVLAPGRPAAK